MATAFVRIKAGAYRSTDVSGQAFQLVEQFKVTGKGGYVTVMNGGKFPGFPDNIRVKVDSAKQYEFISETEFLAAGNAVVATEDGAPVPVSTETDDEVMERIRQRFEILTEMSEAAANGDVRAMIVSGPPGVGKSFGVEKVVEKSVLLDQISGKRLRAEVIKGAATPIGLYQTLYKYSDKNSLIVFDDCDSIFYDDISLNLLKGALDSGKSRKINWMSESRTLKEEGIPNSFSFHGSIIFITNMKFDGVRGKLKDHMEALQSRCHYLDLTLDTMRDKMLRIKQIAKDGELFADYDFEPVVQDEIIAFMDKYQNHLREMSLRMAIKIADLRKSFPQKWEAMAQTTCMKAA
ncbi:MAG TPA: AAA family ATPase [Methanosarcina sp.]|nr:AAA family ATPase [Methanosarcina sp.]